MRLASDSLQCLSVETWPHMRHIRRIPGLFAVWSAPKSIANRELNLLDLKCTMEIVDYRELAAKLKISPKTIQKIWRGLPCVFVGLGRDLRAARFDVNEVWEHLRHERDSLCTARREHSIPDKVRIPRGRASKEGVSKQKRSTLMGSGHTKGTGDASPGGDPFGLLRHLRHEVS